MSQTLHIWPNQSTEQGDRITVSATLEKSGQEPFRLWFRAPSEERDSLSRTCDPFVLAAIFTAMRGCRKIMVHGMVSSSLLRNLHEFQDAWCSWVPAMYSDVEIVADAECRSQDETVNGKTLMVFSGGLDSCFSAYRHRKKRCGRQARDVSAGLMVHGFDIPLEDAGTFGLAHDNSRRILESLDMGIISVATNFRELGDIWDHSHGAGLASCLALFANGYRSGLVGASFSYDSLHLNIPWGSNPVTDGLLSSDDFQIINDGSRFSRIEKFRELTGWPEAMDGMRVCWEGHRLDRNCCRCEKCIRAILCCHVLGMRLPRCFGEDITEQQVLNVRVPDMAILFEYRCMLKTAIENGSSGRVIRMLQNCIRSNEKRLMHRQSIWRRARATMAIRTRTRRMYNRYLIWSK